MSDSHDITYKIGSTSFLDQKFSLNSLNISKLNYCTVCFYVMPIVSMSFQRSAHVFLNLAIKIINVSETA